MKVYIMRGLPCSGKTTLARKFEATHVGTQRGCEGAYERVSYLSADLHHYTEDHEYKFEHKKSRGEAHDAVYLQFIQDLVLLNDHSLGHYYDAVIVDNSNISAWELAPFVRLCEVYKLDYHIYQLVTPLEKCLVRNNGHKVPGLVITTMWERLNGGEGKCPAHWKLSLVSGEE